MSNRLRPGIISQFVTKFVNSFRGVKRVYVGRDRFNNIYYEEENFRAAARKDAQRGYIPGDLKSWDEKPVEWDDWLRNRRKQPPSEEEIKRNVEITHRIKLEAARLEKTGYNPGQIPEVHPGQKPIHENAPFPERKDFEAMPGSHYKEEAFEPKDFEKQKKPTS